MISIYSKPTSAVYKIPAAEAMIILDLAEITILAEIIEST